MIGRNNFGEGRIARLSRWLVAAAVVVAVHICCIALATMNWSPEEGFDDGPGSMVVELETMPVASLQDTPDIAHGAPSEESLASQQSVKETAEEIKAETPPIEPTPPPPEPAAEIPRPLPVEEKEREKEKPKEPERKAADLSAEAAVAAAPPRVEAPKAPTPVPTKGNASPQTDKIRTTWERSLVSHVSRHKRYPANARDQRHQGSVTVQFTIDRDGRVITSRIVSSSGSAFLDEEAAAVLKRASPLPRPPTTVTGAVFDMTLPIRFRLRDARSDN